MQCRNLPAMQETRVHFLGLEDPLEKEMATHFNILAWKVPWTEEPGGLQCMGSQRVRHDLAAKPPPWKRDGKSDRESTGVDGIYIVGSINIRGTWIWFCGQYVSWKGLSRDRSMILVFRHTFLGVVWERPVVRWF